MGKAMVNMTNWQLYVYGGEYNLSGVAENHPRLGKKAHVTRTSSVEKYSLEDDVLIYETRNTIYGCPLKYMRSKPYGNVVEGYKEELTHLADNSDSCLDHIIAVSAKISLGVNLEDTEVQHILKLVEVGQKELAEQEAKENARLCEIAMQYEDCIYIEMLDIGRGDKLAYHIGDCLGIVEPYVHVGTFQDSVLYREYGEGEEDNFVLDFRYFPGPMCDSMKTYSRSKNIKRVVIKNVDDWNITYNNKPIAPGETKCFEVGKTEKQEDE